MLAGLFFLTTSLPAAGQINIEKTRVEDPEGISLAVATTFAFRSGNVTRYDLSSSARVDHKSDKNHIFLLGNVGYGESRGTTYKNRAFAHLRFMHDASRFITTELFGQVENDTFTRLQLRVLAGIGIRIPYVKRDNIAIYQGTSFMFEHESLAPDNVGEHPAEITANRWNNYINIRLKLNDKVAFFNTGYAQPRFDDFGDIRILLDSGLQIELSTRFSFFTSLNLRYDSRPPGTLKSLDIDMRNGLKFDI